MLSGIGTVGGAVAVLIAAIVGRSAFADYRKQKLLERQIEHTDKALVCAYKLNMALSSIRSPMSTESESSESEADLTARNQFENVDADRRRLAIQANIFYIRARRHAEDFDDAVKALPFVKAYLGQKAFDALSELIGCRNSVLVYANAYADDRHVDSELSQKITEHIWEGYGDVHQGDPIKRRIDTAIADLEEIALPILRLESKRDKLGNV